MKILDRELYEAWEKTHRDLPGYTTRIGSRLILGSQTFVFRDGVLAEVIYKNPDLEQQESFREFFRQVRGARGEIHLEMAEGARHGGSDPHCAECRASDCGGCSHEEAAASNDFGQPDEDPE